MARLCITCTNRWKDTLLHSINEKKIEFLVILPCWKYWNCVNVMEKCTKFLSVFYDHTWTPCSRFNFQVYISFSRRWGGGGEKIKNYWNSFFCMIFAQKKVLKQNILQTKILPYHIPNTKEKYFQPDLLAIFIITKSHQSTNNHIFRRVILYTERKVAQTTLLSFGDKIASIWQTIPEILTFDVSRTHILKTCFGHLLSFCCVESCICF